MTRLNIFNTKSKADAAQNVCFEEKKELDRLKAVGDNAIGRFSKYYKTTTKLEIVRETISGDWVYKVYSASSIKYDTIKETTDLFPVIEEE